MYSLKCVHLLFCGGQVICIDGAPVFLAPFMLCTVFQLQPSLALLHALFLTPALKPPVWGCSGVHFEKEANGVMRSLTRLLLALSVHPRMPFVWSPVTAVFSYSHLWTSGIAKLGPLRDLTARGK